MKELDSIEMENPCVYCGRKNRKSIGLIKREAQFTCGCGTIISVNMQQLNALISGAGTSLAGYLKY